MSKQILWFFTFFFLAIAAQGQNIPGSIYSVFGFGDIRERSSPYTRALGNTSVAVRDELNLNVSNPAALTSIGRPITTLFQIGTNYGTTTFNTSSSTFTSKFGSLVGLDYWFRISNKWASVVGVAPYSNVSYSILSSRQLGATSSPTPVNYHGSGGINQFYFGNSYDVFKNLSVGANISFYLGSIVKSEAVAGTNVSNQFSADKQLVARGINADFGIQYSVSIKKTKIIFGGTWDPGASLSGTQQLAIVNPITFDTLRKTDKLTLSTRLPPAYGGGISVRRGRSTFAADIHYLEWTKARFDEVLNYKNTFKYSVGYELKGDFTSFNYLKTISTRAGLWVEDYPLAVRSTYLTSWGYTLGIALPVQGNRATVGLNYSITEMGKTQSDLVRERAHKLSLDIIIRDVWGVKRKFD